MSPVGHSLVGLAFAAVAMPTSRERKWWIGLPFAFVALANLPDWPIPNWGHDRYDISHSIYVNISFIGLAILLSRLTPKFREYVTLRCAMLAAGAWLSHLILDSFYNHGRGVAIYWPFSDGRLNFSISWFNTLDLNQSIFSQHNLSVYAIEFAAYLPILAVSLVIGILLRRQSNKPQQGIAG